MVHAQNRQEQQRWNKIDGEKKNRRNEREEERQRLTLPSAKRKSFFF